MGLGYKSLFATSGHMIMMAAISIYSYGENLLLQNERGNAPGASYSALGTWANKV